MKIGGDNDGIVMNGCVGFELSCPGCISTSSKANVCYTCQFGEIGSVRLV